MNLDHMTEMAFTRLTWREQLAVVHLSVRHALRRLFRREHRYFLVLDGRVVAKFTAQEDHQAVLAWMAEAHLKTHDYAFALGKEHNVAQYLASERDRTQELLNGTDPGAAGTS